jgi:DNA-directed RNA polymerase specialized sigma24 family protein
VLYRVATTRSLNALRAGRRRTAPVPAAPPGVNPPPPTRVGEVLWLEPYPDNYLDEIPDAAAGPAGIYETREAVSLAFITALQLLPPRQRAVLVLRDVLQFLARDVAEMLDVTEQSVTSALKRARSTLAAHRESQAAAPSSARTTAEEQLVAQLVDAFERGDVPDIVALLTDDVRVTMPPLPLEYEGRDLAGESRGSSLACSPHSVCRACCHRERRSDQARRLAARRRWYPRHMRAAPLRPAKSGHGSLEREGHHRMAGLSAHAASRAPTRLRLCRNGCATKISRGSKARGAAARTGSTSGPVRS